MPHPWQLVSKTVDPENLFSLVALFAEPAPRFGCPAPEAGRHLHQRHRARPAQQSGPDDEEDPPGEAAGRQL